SDAGAGIGYTYLRVRGSDATRINVTINGIPYNDAESQGTFWVNLGDFASSTQSLQLQRGVGTSTNGSGAFGASLNLLTDAISDKPFGEISNSFGSYATRKHTVKLSSGLINDQIELVGRLSNIYSDGYVDRAFTDLKSYFLQASYITNNTLIKVLTFGGKEKTYQSWFGLTAEQLEEDRRQNPYTYENETDNYEQNHYQLHWNQRFNDNWSTNIALNYTKGEGFFEQFRPEESAEDFANLIEDGSDVIVRRWLDNDFYVANFNLNYKNDRLDIITGLSFSQYTGDHFGEVIWGSQLAENTNIRDRYYFSDAKKSDFSFFSKASVNLNEKWEAYLDLQGRFVNYATDGLTSSRVAIDIDKNFGFFNPKLGLTYTLNSKNSLYASYARAQREPNRSDFEENPTIEPEKLNDFELGWRFKSAQIQLNTNIYYMAYKDQLVLTGAIDDVGARVRSNSDKSYRLGLEIDAALNISNKFSIRPNLAISENMNQDFVTLRDGELVNLGNTQISFSPSLILGNAIIYQPTNNLEFALLSKYVGEQYMGNIDEESSKLASYFINDFNASYEIRPKKIFTSITLTALVNNIFNKEYVSNGYFGAFDFPDATSTTGTRTGYFTGFYPQATTNFLLGATFKF
ncbi:MAG: TonB-dependent receptor, partial [Flavobacteriaceae bacterium]|nr:TonB-dependent receptor [Flavobacteriaceae bacterium]